MPTLWDPTLPRCSSPTQHIQAGVSAVTLKFLLCLADLRFSQGHLTSQREKYSLPFLWRLPAPTRCSHLWGGGCQLAQSRAGGEEDTCWHAKSQTVCLTHQGLTTEIRHSYFCFQTLPSSFAPSLSPSILDSCPEIVFLLALKMPDRGTLSWKC